MTTFETSVNINRPVSQVFAFLADTSNAPRWYDAVVAATKLTPGPIGNGTRHQLVRSLPGGPVENEVEITDYQPVSQLTQSSVSGPTPFRYVFTLEPTPGGTRLALSGDITTEGLHGPAAVFGPIASIAFKRGMTHNLNTLKRLLESP